jgi:NAD(P)H-hydrate epimerase
MGNATGNNTSSAWDKLRGSVLTVEQHRQVDRLAVEEYRMHSLVLMENAARGCIQWLQQRFGTPSGAEPRRMVVLCGKGNNGGDGLAIARHAEALGWQCTTFVAGDLESLAADARANATILLSDPAARDNSLVFWNDQATERLEASLSGADVVLDAMLGTGTQGSPKPPFDGWIRAANASRCMRVAIDVPTGVDATSGSRASTSFRADATLTFVALKPAMVLPHARDLFGQIIVLPIGIPRSLMDRLHAGLGQSSLSGDGGS